VKKTAILFIAAVIFLSSCGEGETETTTLVANTPKKDKSILVKTRTMATNNVAHTFTATGGAEASQSAFISSEMNGQIKKIHVTEGQFVQKGTLLVSLNSSVISSSIGEVKSGLDLATIMFNKQDTLWNNLKVGKEVDFLTAKNQKESLEAKLNTLYAQLEMTKVRAPFSGIVDEIHGQPGELASPGRMLVQFVNLNSMKILADVSENYLPYINKGDEVELSFPAFPQKTIKTKIARLGNVINPANRTFKIELKIDNPGGKIKPNMVASIQVTDYENSHFTVPAIIVKNDRKGEYVYVVDNNRAKKVYVKSGLPIGNEVIVETGIKANDKVIVEGYNLVSEGVTVRF